MGKFDGMDPKLVRDLLSEVNQASKQMRAVEGQVTRLMSGAGLSSQSTHRPSQIADACEVMVRDVSARVALLEKRIRQESAPLAEPKAGEPKIADSGADGKSEPKPDSGADGKSEPKPERPKVEDLKPAVPKGDEAPPSRDQSPDSGSKDDPKPESKKDTDSGSKGETGSKGDETSPRKGEPTSEAPRGDPDSHKVTVHDPRTANVNDTAPDAKPDTGSKADETSPRDGGSVSEAPPRVEGVDDTGSKGETGSKGDERSPRDGGGVSGVDLPDTAGKDHPDDVDQRGDMKPRVVAVDGVQVLQVPLDSPTAAEVAELLKNIEDIPPLEMPGVEGASDTTGAQPDRVDPTPAPPWTDSDISVPDTVEPDPEQRVQPPGTGGESGTQSAGNAPGSAETPPAETAVGESAARWASDGTDVVSVQADPPSADALRTLADNARDIEPLDMPGVQVPDGETWGEGAWAPMDVGPDGSAGDVDPGDPLQPIPPPGGGRVGGQ
ncbi:hypothetical protein [Streptosporangium roseum]|uniref:Uncharacterized protein n=1 Tax=Streptosporangium roseum (strain ATCC 12428 / DSM 43021 / JCM 3005 / KCTC 9067 / NCIMB 10171 / NRRL 2505 / NI 9100) TaxID=479432 RepID=D2ARX1_STRRD|nr:hypothetical protein [Streptosporangium roseum]ACZ84650.1 hypothetical protein Sros_1659 [Streptosporangium roseum DSM 43021]